MGELKDKLLEEVSAERDQYFIDLYDKAKKIATESSMAKSNEDEKPIVGAEDIGEELKKLLAEELSLEDFEEEANRFMYHYAYYLHLTLSKNKPPEDASDQDISDYGRYLSKFAAIQQALITYTLGENDCANAVVALNNWYKSPKGQVAHLTVFCEHYQSDLERVIHNLEYAFFKFSPSKQTLDNLTLVEARNKLVSVTELLEFLQNDMGDHQTKIKKFKDMYEQSVIYKPLQEAKGTFPSICAHSVSTMFKRNLKTGVQQFNMDLSERENIAGIDNVLDVEGIKAHH